MMLMNHRLRPSRLTLAAALFVGLTSTALLAQQNGAESSDVEVSSTTPVANIFAPTTLNLAASEGLNYSSSNASTDITIDPATAATLDLGTATQPPPRRRYSRPRYNDNSHNADGSSKYEFEVGAGFTAPIGNTYHYLNTSYGIQVGGGRDFSKQFGVLLQFDYDRFGFNGRTLGNQIQLYDYGVSPSSSYYLTQLDGNSHVWSFTLNPHYNIPMQGPFGAYAVAGAGFFHKTANFTVPETGTYCDYYYGCYQYSANSTIDKYTSNAPGVNGGFGLTFKPSRFAGERLFVEGRYNLMLNSQKTGISVFSSTATLNSYTGANYYPANSNRTTWLSFKAGLRF